MSLLHHVLVEDNITTRHLTKKFASNLTKETSPFYYWLPPTRASRTSRNPRNANDYSKIKCKNERYRKSALPFIVRLLN